MTRWLYEWLYSPPWSTDVVAGGAEGTRTPNPCLAKAVLCQLSYGPVPAGEDHRFEDISADLAMVVMFAPPYESRRI